MKNISRESKKWQKQKEMLLIQLLESFSVSFFSHFAMLPFLSPHLVTRKALESFPCGDGKSFNSFLSSSCWLRWSMAVSLWKWKLENLKSPMRIHQHTTRRARRQQLLILNFPERNFIKRYFCCCSVCSATALSFLCKYSSDAQEDPKTSRRYYPSRRAAPNARAR